MKKIIYSTPLVLMFLVCAAKAEIPSTNKLITKKKSFLSDFKEKSSLSHFSIFEGPALNNLNDDVPGEDGNPNGKLNSWHQVSYRYQINKNFRFVINPRFSMDYSKERGDDSDNFSVLNPVVGITGTWYKNGNFSFRGGINTMLVNVEEGSQEDGLIANPGGFQTINYKVSSKVDVGSWLWFRFYAFSEDAGEELFRSSISPFVQYTVNDKISFQAWYDTFVEHDEERSINNIHMKEDTDIGIGMYYAINKKLTIFPHIKANPDQNYDEDSVSLNAWVFGSF
jgi:hypothetical protein